MFISTLVRWIIIEVPNQYKIDLKTYLAEKEVTMTKWLKEAIDEKRKRDDF